MFMKIDIPDFLEDKKPLAKNDITGLDKTSLFTLLRGAFVTRAILDKFKCDTDSDDSYRLKLQGASADCKLQYDTRHTLVI